MCSMNLLNANKVGHVQALTNLMDIPKYQSWSQSIILTQDNHYMLDVIFYSLVSTVCLGGLIILL